ncbi:hypothetical protein EYC80_003338 [Monilinia laxa]|uniref:Uncharacterized protein n=1 Tax=Monilinia laxa TaxID=61186 RepID=A0A5N6KES0_MONLA|nr:hypothetical protein EYC80_003338 [Monilinia laxa]
MKNIPFSLEPPSTLYRYDKPPPISMDLNYLGVSSKPTKFSNGHSSHRTYKRAGQYYCIAVPELPGCDFSNVLFRTE